MLYPRKDVFLAMRDNYKEYWNDLSNIESFEMVKKKKLNDDKIEVVVEWKGKAPIPKILQHLLQPKMLCWKDTGVWDEKDWTLT